MERREILPFFGTDGVGKSSLISALFPSLQVDYKEPDYYKDYVVEERLYIREMSGKDETISILIPAMSKWRVDKAVAVFDLTKKESLAWIDRIMDLINWNFVLVANKADLQEKEVSLEEVSSYARNKGIKLFVVSASTGEGIDELRRALLGEAPVESVVPLEELTKPVEEVTPSVEEAGPPIEEEKEEPVSQETIPTLAPRKDYLPIPFKVPPDTEGLSDIEIMLFELIDGKKTAFELANELGLDYRTVQIYLKKFHAEGRIKDLRLVVK